MPLIAANTAAATRSPPLRLRTRRSPCTPAVAGADAAAAVPHRALPRFLHRTLQASVVPALAGLLITPLLMYKLFAPEIKDTPEAPKVRCGACMHVWGVMRAGL